MNRTSYLQFHAKIIWETSQLHNKALYHCHYSPSDKIIEVKGDTYLLQNWNKIASEGELCQLLNTKYLFVRYTSVISLLLENIFKHGSSQELSYFVNNYQPLIGNIDLESIINILPKLNSDQISKILNNNSLSTAIFDMNLMEKLIKNILFIEEPEKVLSNYLFKNIEHFKIEAYQVRMLNLILENFPNSINKFKKIFFVEEYISAQKNTLFYEHIQETLLICINLATLKNKIKISDYVLDDYKQILHHFMGKVQKEEGVFNIDVIDINHDKNTYSHTNIYINEEKNKKSKLTNVFVENMIVDYYSFLKQQNLTRLDKTYLLEEFCNKWISSYNTHSKLEKELIGKIENQTIIKKNKL